MATVSLKKLYTVTKPRRIKDKDGNIKITTYDYPVIESEIVYKDGSTKTAWLSIFRENSFQLSGTVSGDWDLGSYYFGDDPLKNHLNDRLSFDRFLELKGREAIKANESRLSININEETKNLLYDFTRAAWVAYTNDNKCGTRSSEDNYRWYKSLPNIYLELEED